MNLKDPLFADSDRFASLTRQTPPERLGARTQATRDHETIRRWAVDHGADPATGEATESGPATIAVNDGEKTGFRRNGSCANGRAEGLRQCGIASSRRTPTLDGDGAF
jgi:hypothetical protein